ncbi:WD repeat-containing protein 87 [Terramyces sp. JEL0728]|nr:WD repeat-containing protein 87 [Terramyces sp. JEL0728]
MEYIKQTHSLVVGEVGSIRIIGIKKSTHNHIEIYVLYQILEISVGLDEEWITCVYYDHSKERIFAGCGTNLYVFDYHSGERIDNYYDIHELSITFITYYEPNEYLITGAKDGTIKLWNARKSLLYDFHDHFNAITGLLLLENICEDPRGSTPLLISSSLDGTIRMWNFESGQCLYRMETNGECLDRLYCLNNNNTITVYETNTNPFKIDQFWEKVHNDPISCLCAGDFYNYSPRRRPDVDKRVLFRNELALEFILFCGTETGQIHYINLQKAADRQEFLCQAHSTSLTMLYFDVQQACLISGGSDDTIKIWNIHLNASKQTGFQQNNENRKMVIDLKCVCTLTVSGADQPSFRYGFSSIKKQLAIPSNGSLVLTPYDKNRTITPVSIETQVTSKILNIVSNGTEQYWASSHQDRTVKIWDKSGILLREIQFNEDISCLLFANHRGDLLVGLSDQISLVKLQDYMPAHIQRLILTREYGDDIPEAPITFDQSVDFWVYDGTRSLADTNRRTSFELFKNDGMTFEELLELSRLRKDEAIKRRNRRIQMEQQQDLFHKALEYESKENQQSQQTNADYLPELGTQTTHPSLESVAEIHMPQGYVPSGRSFDYVINKQMVENDKELAEKGIYFGKEVESLNKAVLQKLKPPREKFKDRFKKRRQSRRPTAKELNLPPSSGGSTVEEVEQEPEKRQEDITEEESIEFRPSEVGEFDTDAFDDEYEEELEFFDPFVSQEDEKRKSINIKTKRSSSVQRFINSRANSIKPEKEVSKKVQVGLMLPNSVALPSILPMYKGGQKLKKNETIFRKTQTKDLYQRASLIDNAEDEDSIFSKFKAKKSASEPVDFFDIDEDEEPKYLDLETSPEPLPELVKQPSVTLLIPEVQQSILPVKEPDPFVEPIPQITPEPTVLEIKEAPQVVIEETPSVIERRSRKRRAKSSKKRPKPSKTKKGSKSKKKAVSDIEEDIEVVGPTRIVKVLKRPIPVKSNGGEEVTKKLLKTHGLTERRIINAALEEEPEIPVVSSNNPVTMMKNANIEALNTLTPEKVAEPAKAPSPVSAITPVIPIVPPKLKPQKETVHSTEALVNLYAKVKHGKYEKPSQSRLADPILKAFEKMNTRFEEPITISKISKNLTGFLQKANAEDTAIASKAIISLHKMFKYDLKPEVQFDMFLAPFIDKYQNDDAVIRRHVISSLGEIGVQHDNVLSLLICALNDNDKNVIKLAIDGLSSFGIADKEALKRGMIELGIVKGKHHFSSNQILEKIERDLELESAKQIEIKLEHVAEWLDKNSHKYSIRALNRTDSYLEHLAGQFFPADAHDFDGRQRQLAMAMDANINYDYYWNEKNKEAIMDSEYSFDDQNSRNSRFSNSVVNLTKDSRVSKGLSKYEYPEIKQARPRTTTVLEKRQTAAKIALSNVRVMTAGPMRNYTHAPPDKKENVIKRPITAFPRKIYYTNQSNPSENGSNSAKSSSSKRPSTTGGANLYGL